MSGADERLLAEVAGQARAAWRRPRLFAVAANGVDADAAEALLDDLLRPVADVGDGVQRLIDSGDFAAAKRMLALPGLGLSAEETAELTGRVHRRVAGVRAELRPLAHRLEIRARALGLSEAEQPWAALVEDSESEAKAALEEFRAQLDSLTSELRASIEAGFDGLDAERRAGAKACLEAGEYAVAQRIVTDLDTESWRGNPTAVANPPRWEYGRFSDPLVLRWFTGVEKAPPDFELHLPVDEPGRRLIAALAAVHEAVDERSALELADALDGAVEESPIKHRVTRAGQGFTVALHGFHDFGLDWLALPRSLPLHIGPDAPVPDGSTVLWLDTAGGGEAPDGVARLEPRLLFRLMERDLAGRAPTPRWRKINVLRAVCAQLSFDRVVRPLDESLDDRAAVRATLLWVFDLLGLRASPEVPDMVMYYTAEVPAALAAVLRKLSQVVRRPGRLTHDDLTELRSDVDSVEAVRAAVFAPLVDDRAAGVVCAALLLCAARLGRDRVPHGELDHEVEQLTLQFMVEYERDWGRAPEWYLDQARLDVDAAVLRLEDVGLALPGTEIGLPGQGLVTLLAGEHLTSWAVAELHRLHRDVDEVEEHARLVLLARTERQNRHVRSGYEYSLGLLEEELGRTSEPTRRQRLERRIATHHELIAQVEAIERHDVNSLLRATDVDLIDLVAVQVEVEKAAGRMAVTLVDHTDGHAVVHAVELLVRLAVVDLLHNAEQAMRGADSPRRVVRVTVRHRTDAVERFAVVDIEDSGPGFGNVPRVELDHARHRAGMPGGEGLRLVQRNLQASRGRLKVLGTRSSLGGAHVAIWLPLAD
ncbi:ATP-binding protein [Actinokineospora bangkokensis]|uniref:Histidine kinase/HSP90-like ATPase domain-containing protein n=1 Tax=Actinokineospora bangkokensis TaxID=1193682 RepID=A0A1Q9LIK2_9PSEU|nr:HAMP domain-containing histidine kinase [Actinokineospora bangkokensis]OLR91856.1 hypothetical protein BJP25_23760 [Actinokineospora bangkokensis]